MFEEIKRGPNKGSKKAKRGRKTKKPNEECERLCAIEKKSKIASKTALQRFYGEPPTVRKTVNQIKFPRDESKYPEIEAMKDLEVSFYIPKNSWHIAFVQN